MKRTSIPTNRLVRDDVNPDQVDWFSKTLLFQAARNGHGDLRDAAGTERRQSRRRE